MDMGVRLALRALHPPFETHSTWYAAGRQCWPLLSGKTPALNVKRGRHSEICRESPYKAKHRLIHSHAARIG
jgi:hypothetical protein